MEQKGYARYSEFDFQIKDLSKWHEIENNKDVLQVLGIIREGNKFYLSDKVKTLLEALDTSVRYFGYIYRIRLKKAKPQL